MFNAPKRPEYLFIEETHKRVPLRYRTHINPEQVRYHKEKVKITFDPILPDSIRAQCYIYRWARSLDYAPGVPIGELADFLGIGKRHMGMCVSQALMYDAKRMKVGTVDGRVPKNTWTLCPIYVEELIYGLEWQICSWLHQCIRKKSSDLEEELDELSLSSRSEVEFNFIKLANDQIRYGEMMDINWMDIQFVDDERERVKAEFEMNSANDGKKPPRSIL